MTNITFSRDPDFETYIYSTHGLHFSDIVTTRLCDLRKEYGRGYDMCIAQSVQIGEEIKEITSFNLDHTENPDERQEITEDAELEELDHIDTSSSEPESFSGDIHSVLAETNVLSDIEVDVLMKELVNANPVLKPQSQFVISSSIFSITEWECIFEYLNTNMLPDDLKSRSIQRYLQFAADERDMLLAFIEKNSETKPLYHKTACLRALSQA